MNTLKNTFFIFTVLLTSIFARATELQKGFDNWKQNPDGTYVVGGSSGLFNGKFEAFDGNRKNWLASSKKPSDQSLPTDRILPNVCKAVIDLKSDRSYPNRTVFSAT